MHNDPSLPLLDESEPVIRVTYHPHSHRSDTWIPLPEYRHRRTSNSPIQGMASDTLPAQDWWKPFGSEADFDFTEFVTRHRLPNSVIDDLLHRLGLWCDSAKVTFKTHRDVDNISAEAVASTTKVSNWH